jgi:hypothetical protein
VGTWGVAIFDGDLAADVRDEWRSAILGGLGSEEATARLLAELSPAFDDSEDGIVAWLALAAAQHETGRLQPDVRDRALALIDAGGDVASWAEGDAALGRRRQKVLERLAAKLRGPQPKPKRIRPPRTIEGVPFGLGDVVRLRNPERGAEALFVVVDHDAAARKAVPDPVVEVLLWEGGPVPEPERLATMPVLLEQTDGGGLRSHMTVVGTHTKDSVFGPEFGELVTTAVPRRPSRDFRELPEGHSSWRNLTAFVGGPWHRRLVELTRAALGDRDVS